MAALDYGQARRTMVDTQVRPSDVTDYAVIDAMLWAPREMFVPEQRRALAYADENLRLPTGQVILSPRTFAKMLQVACIRRDDMVLDVGCALGYSSAVASRLAGAVIALESDPEMTRAATDGLAELGVENCAVLSASLAEGDPRHAPYDVILVNGGIQTTPERLRRQLKDGGRLVVVRVTGVGGACTVTSRIGEAFGEQSMFDASAPVLKEFTAAEEFEF